MQSFKNFFTHFILLERQTPDKNDIDVVINLIGGLKNSTYLSPVEMRNQIYSHIATLTQYESIYNDIIDVVNRITSKHNYMCNLDEIIQILNNIKY